jgi:6-phosphofructokinase 1
LTRRRTVGILTGGGDTAPLNTLLFSLRNRLAGDRVRLVGFVKGWDGVLNKRFVDLHRSPDFGRIGGTFLKSSRRNLALGSGFERANRSLSEQGVERLVVVGGDDTLSNVYGISAAPCLAVSKTIDNDLGIFSAETEGSRVVNYFTLGYPTAAEKIARFVSLEHGIRTTAYSHDRLMIVESMGMQAGWLALASSFGNPDFILIPEFPLDYADFLDKLKRRYAEKEHVIVVAAEGVRFSGHELLYENAGERDAFGNPRFGGAALALAARLKKDMAGAMEVRNINAVNPSYWYRSGAPNAVDADAAERTAERCAAWINGPEPSGHGFVEVTCSAGKIGAETRPFSDFEKTEHGRFPKREVPGILYDADRACATDRWAEYLSPLVPFRSAVTGYGLNLERQS